MRYDWSVSGGLWLVWMKMWGKVLRGRICVAFFLGGGGSRCGWESQRFVTLNNRVVAGTTTSCSGGGTCCVGGGSCGWEPQQIVTLKNRKMWREAQFGGTYGVEVGLPARGDMRILHVKSYRWVGLAASGDPLCLREIVILKKRNLGEVRPLCPRQLSE